jgi:zinc transport system substrate-binding protein
MDMSLARLQAEAVAAALQKRWPEYLEIVAANLQQLLKDLDALDAAYEQQARQLSTRQLIYSHPVYQYFERRYELGGRSLHWEPDVMPSDKQWRDLQQMLNEASLFVWEGEPDPAIAERMRALGLAFVVLDPAANLAGKDWLSVQRENLQRLSR